MVRFLRRLSLPVLVAAVAVSAAAQSTQPSPPTAAQQRPVFRGGTHFVRVDAYPTPDGQIVEGLEEEDFVILEVGNPTKIHSFDIYKFATIHPPPVCHPP